MNNPFLLETIAAERHRDERRNATAHRLAKQNKADRSKKAGTVFARLGARSTQPGTN